ncbi:MAG TPA: hypothetical protein VE777_05925 [Gaiellales bacterium]|jgi:hypothetical protein|nr:hypothetical protein [Gaiellales bacterium]
MLSSSAMPALLAFDGDGGYTASYMDAAHGAERIGVLSALPRELVVLS